MKYLSLINCWLIWVIVTYKVTSYNVVVGLVGTQVAKEKGGSNRKASWVTLVPIFCAELQASSLKWFLELCQYYLVNIDRLCENLWDLTCQKNVKKTTTVFRLVIAAQFPDSFVVTSFNHSGSPLFFPFFFLRKCFLFIVFRGRVSHFAHFPRE